MPTTTIELTGELEHLSILDQDGALDEELEPDIPADDLRSLFTTMVLSRRYDQRRLNLQRQGRIGTFAPAVGQEAAQLGSAYALRPSDWLVPAFRELTAGLWRGLDPVDDLLYTAGYEEGIALPEDARDLPICIPVASQIPHAVGIAWGCKLDGVDDAVLTYFGDGATSNADFHEGLNFAGVFGVPAVFLCQNNQYAISLPRSRQTAAETLAQKALAYGITARQVDGNDLLAVYVATRDALRRARDGDGPTMIEAVTYRLEIHTTADDPGKYRDEEEEERWRQRDPLPRFRDYLVARGVLDDDEVEGIEEDADERIRDAVSEFEERAEQLGDPLDMFEHIYSRRHPYLEQQRRELAEELGRGGEGPS